MQFILRANNFKGDTRVVTADTGDTLLREVKRVYSLENVPDTMDIQVWEGYDGTRRIRLDKEAMLNPTTLSCMAHVRIVKRINDPNQCPVPVEEGLDAS
jgi:hypothetical protein